LFWVDLALGPAIACLLAGVALGRPARVVRMLDVRPLRGLGSISYSLYLTHAPIVIALYFGLLAGWLRPGVPTFLVMVVVVVPVTILFARLFAAVFEIPFRRARGWPLGSGAARGSTPAARPELGERDGGVDQGVERDEGREQLEPGRVQDGRRQDGADHVATADGEVSTWFHSRACPVAMSTKDFT
jgi:hypothetical protein